VSNTKPENQTAPAQLINIAFDGHDSSGIYPDSLVVNPNTIFAIKCRCVMLYDRREDGI
jgi:hypothetical protein